MKKQSCKNVIWSLFDSENAIMKNLEPGNEVYCFGIGNGKNHIHLDLAEYGETIRALKQYPKPDLIFASPPCETWVNVSVGNKRFYTKEKGLNLYWKEKWIPFDFTEAQKKRRINGIATAETTALAIKTFKPKHWFIENGSHSLIFDYLRKIIGLVGYRNFTNYFSYGFNYLKPTTIYSDFLLLLQKKVPQQKLQKVCKHKSGNSKASMAILRSEVPFALYKDILLQVETGLLL